MDVLALCPACRWLRERIDTLLTAGEVTVRDSDEMPPHMPNCRFNMLGAAAAMVDADPFEE